MNKKLFLNEIVFDEKQHKYSIVKNNGELIRINLSVTGLISKLFPFNEDTIISNMIKNHKNWKDEQYTKLKIGLDENDKNFKDKLKSKIKGLWKKKRDTGTDVHKMCEKWLTRGIVNTENEFDVYFEAIKHYMKMQNSKGYFFKWSELKLGDETINIVHYGKGLSGTADIILYNEKEDKYKIVDIKVAKSNYNKKLQWMLQLGLYHLLIQRTAMFPYKCDYVEILRMDKTLYNDYEVFKFKITDCLNLINSKITFF
jgi:hypothetical protein